MSNPQSNEQTIRQELRAIVTRNGMSNRIPELLEDELDKLEQLITRYGLEQRKAELESHGGQWEVWPELKGKEVQYDDVVKHYRNRIAEITNELASK